MQSKETTVLEDLPRVTLAEDEDGAIHMRNLGANLAGTEEEALNLLFIGDTNRMIAETPMNLASSRSHCIFTVTIESRPVGGDVVRGIKATAHSWCIGCWRAQREEPDTERVGPTAAPFVRSDPAFEVQLGRPRRVRAGA